MKLKERRYNLVFDNLKEVLLDSDRDIDVAIEFNWLEEGVNRLCPIIEHDEIAYSIRQLIGKNYLANYDPSRNSGTTYKLTQKGIDEWLLPMNGVDIRKIFLSYSTKDKDLADEIKQGLSGMDFSVFMAPEDIQGGAKWLDVIISNLTTTTVFISLRTESYEKSSACEQECGFALAMKKRIISLCIGTSPSNMGFCAEYQGQGFETNSELITNIINYCKAQLS